MVMEKKIALAGIVISILIHVLFFAVLSIPPSSIKPSEKSVQALEVTYQAPVPLPKRQELKPDKRLSVVKKKKNAPKQNVKVLSKKSVPFSSLKDPINDVAKKRSGRTNATKSRETVKFDLDRKILLPPLSTEKINNPQFITYNEDMRDVIRRNIKKKAYSYVNHPDFETGEVYLTFVLDSNGVLKRVKIINDKTFANDYLREVALRSIKESSPFPKFPKGFDYPEFTFNLLISFQN